MSKSTKTTAKRSRADDNLDAALQADVQAAAPAAVVEASGESLATTQAAPAADAAPPPAPLRGGSDIFQPLDDKSGERPARDLEMIMDIPVKLSVELGRTRLTIKELLELAQGSVVELDGLPGEPMDILINGYLIARGEVVVVEDRFGIRITEIITPSERLHRLNS